ncbi:MAG: response regulator, partial [bacterium]
MTNRIIVIDDDPDYLALLGSRLAELGYADVTQRHDPVAVAAEFDQGARYDLALIDMTMPGMSGLELLAHIRGASPDTECIIVTAVNEARVAVDCLRMGAYDYLLKPVPADALALAINRTLERKRLLDILGLDKGGGPLALDRPEPFAPIVTRSPNVRRVLREAELHAGSSVPILITGESG